MLRVDNKAPGGLELKRRAIDDTAADDLFSDKTTHAWDLGLGATGDYDSSNSFPVLRD